MMKDLPEGWERFKGVNGCNGVRRSDGAAALQHNGKWKAYGPLVIDFLFFDVDFPTAQAAMEALDREYPMEKQHGEK